MKIKVINVFVLTLALLILTSTVSLASTESTSLNQKINNILNSVEGYSIVDENDYDVTNNFLDVFDENYNINSVLSYLSQRRYSIKTVDENNQSWLRSSIINRSYGATYTKILQKDHNGTIIYLEISFQLLGELDFDNSTGVITNVYHPGVYILGFDKPASVSSIQVSSGLLSNGNRTVNHSIVINCKMQVKVNGDIYEWVDMPTIYQNFSYTPSVY